MNILNQEKVFRGIVFESAYTYQLGRQVSEADCWHVNNAALFALHCRPLTLWDIITVSREWSRREPLLPFSQIKLGLINDNSFYWIIHTIIKINTDVSTNGKKSRIVRIVRPIRALSFIDLIRQIEFVTLFIEMKHSRRGSAVQLKP